MGEESILGGGEKGTGAEGEENSLSKDVHSVYSLPRLVPVVIAHTGFLYPTPILRMGKLRSAQGTDRYASYQEASVEDDTVFLLQPQERGLCIRDGAPAGCGVSVSPHLPPHPTRPRSFVPAPGLSLPAPS